MAEATDAVPTQFDPPEDGAFRVYLGDDKKNLECRYYEEQVSLFILHRPLVVWLIFEKPLNMD